MPSESDIELLLNRLAVHRSTLSILLDQLARHTDAYAPPSVFLGIREARQEIRRIKAFLSNSGVPVEDLPDDEAAPSPNPTLDSTTAPSAARPLRVFLAHASPDKPAVRQLYGRLRDVGVTPWLDAEDLLPGQNWQREISKAIRESDVVLVCLSRSSITKAGYVHRETVFALDIVDEQPEASISLIPLRLEDCEVPERLRHFHWLDLFSDDGFNQLLRALWLRAAQVGATPPTVEPADLPRALDTQAPRLSPSAARARLWRQAQIAYQTMNWEQAELLLAEVAKLDPSYEDVQARLVEARRQIDVQRRYENLAALRSADQWKEALTELDTLAKLQPNYPDPQRHRAWAEDRRVADLRATLLLSLPPTIRHQFEEELSALIGSSTREQPSDVCTSDLAGRDAHTGTKGTVDVSRPMHGAAVGVNQGIIQVFFGTRPPQDAGRLLNAYLDTLRERYHSLTLGRLLDKERSGDDQPTVPSLPLRVVYTALCTDAQVPRERFELTIDTLTEALAIADPDRTAPDDLRFPVVDLVDFHEIAAGSRTSRPGAEARSLCELWDNLNHATMRACTGNTTAKLIAGQWYKPELAVEAISAPRSRIVLLGDPGSGKSTVLRYLVVVIAETLLHSQTNGPIELRGWAGLPLPVPIMCSLSLVARELDDILLGKGFVLPCLSKKVEVFGHQRREFIGVATEIGQYLLNGCPKLGKGRVVGVAHDLLAQELPEPLDQVQIRRVGWQKQQPDA